MAGVQVLMMMGLSMSFPLLPLYLQHQLGLGSGPDVILWSGLVTSASFATLAIFNPIWGTLADRYGRRVMVIRSAVAVGLFNFLTVIVTDKYQLLVVRLGMGVFSGFGAASIAMVGSVTPREQLGYALGIIGAAQTAGNVFGPLLGGLVATAYGYRIAFLCTGVLSLLAGLVTVCLVPEDSGAQRGGEAAERPGLLRGIGLVARSRDLVVMFTVLALNRLAIGGVGPVTTLFVGDLRVREDLVPTVAGMVLSAAGLGQILTAPYLGRLSDKRGCRPVLIGCLAGTALTFLPQYWASAAWQLIAVRFVFGLFSGGIQPSAYAIIGYHAPPGQQSTAYGMTFSATAIGNLTGPIMSGALAAAFGLRPVFIYTAALIGANALWVAAGGRASTGLASRAGSVPGQP